MPPRPVVEFFFSPGSRHSYLAASQMPRLEAETGCTVDWKPVNGGDIARCVATIPSLVRPSPVVRVTGAAGLADQDSCDRFWEAS